MQSSVVRKEGVREKSTALLDTPLAFKSPATQSGTVMETGSLSRILQCGLIRLFTTSRNNTPLVTVRRGVAVDKPTQILTQREFVTAQ